MPTVNWGEIAQLSLMLSSAHDGEIAAAARAIERKLVKAGLDWHDYSHRLSAGPQSNGHAHRAQEPPRQERKAERRFNDYANRSYEELERQMDVLFMNSENLGYTANSRAKNRDFIESNYYRFKDYGRRFHFSEKQSEWFDDLWTRFGGQP